MFQLARKVAGNSAQRSIKEKYKTVLVDLAHLCLPMPAGVGTQPDSGVLNFTNILGDSRIPVHYPQAIFSMPHLEGGEITCEYQTPVHVSAALEASRRSVVCRRGSKFMADV
jgi:hypothetical protein